MEPKIVILPPLKVLDELLTRIIYKSVSFMNNPPFGPFGFAQGPEPVEGLRLRSFRSPLRVSLERGVKHRVETHKKAICFNVGAHSRAKGFVNGAG